MKKKGNFGPISQSLANNNRVDGYDDNIVGLMYCKQFQGCTSLYSEFKLGYYSYLGGGRFGFEKKMKGGLSLSLSLSLTHTQTFSYSLSIYLSISSHLYAKGEDNGMLLHAFEPLEGSNILWHTVGI